MQKHLLIISVEISNCNVCDFFKITTIKMEKLKIGLGYACMCIMSHFKFWK